MVVREMRVHVPAAPAEVFRFLSDAANVPLFAPGVEEAVLLGGVNGEQGARLGLRTRRGRELRAQLTHYDEGEGWTVVDERSTVMQMQVEDVPHGGALVTATLRGTWPPEQETRVVAEWERKLAELPERFPTLLAAR